MRLALPDGKDGLNDDGEEVDVLLMKAEFKKFIDLDEIKNAALTDFGYKKMLTQQITYKDRLFTAGVEVIDKRGNKIACDRTSKN